MKKILYCTIIAGLLLSSGCYASKSISYSKIKTYNTIAHVITINLKDPDIRVSVALARGGRGSSESFKSIVKRTKPSAAITGTFFDTKTLIPTGDIALFGTVVHSGCLGSALCINSDNKASIIPYKIGRKTRWDGFETVLCAGPSLISNGKISIALKQEGFRRSLQASARRTAVGITDSKKLVFVAINRNVSLYKIAKVMLRLKVRNALCLDGGSSTGFYGGGSYKAIPGRSLTNLLVAYSNPTDYYNSKNALVPNKLFAKAQKYNQNIFNLREISRIIPLSHMAALNFRNKTPQINSEKVR